MKKSSFWVYLLAGLLFVFFAILMAFGLGNDQDRDGADWGVIVTFGMIFLAVGVALLMCSGRYYAIGKPRDFLPNKTVFKKVAEYSPKNSFYIRLLLLKVDDDGNFPPDNLDFYELRKDILLNKDNAVLKVIPEIFFVRIGKRREKGQKFKKEPTMEIVYYLN